MRDPLRFLVTVMFNGSEISASEVRALFTIWSLGYAAVFAIFTLKGIISAVTEFPIGVRQCKDVILAIQAEFPLHIRILLTESMNSRCLRI
jgi:hypothetical protein